MNYRTAFLLTLLFAALLAWGMNRNKPPAPAPASFSAQGYGGEIAMKMSLSPEGTITDLKIIRHNETTSYIGRINSFLKQFIGRSGKDDIVLGKDIDAISGATITSRGITDAVRREIHTPVQEKKERPSLMPAAITLLLFLLAILALVRRHNALRWAALAGGFAYFGIITHTMLSIIQIVQAGLGHAPSLTTDPLTFSILLLTFIAALIVGRIYCGSLCPFASLQEVLHLLTRHRRPVTEYVSPAVDSRARTVKYILLFAVTGLCLVLGNAAAANIEPFITLFTGHGSKLALLLLGLMLILAVFNFRFWCKYLCPVGALTGIAAVFSMNKIRPTAACSACGTCSRVCPTQAITTDAKGKPVIDPAECIVCARCLRACPDKALIFGCRCHEKK